MRTALKTAISFFVAGFILTGFLYARPSAEAGTKELTIYSIRGPSGIGLVRLFEDVPHVRGFAVKVEALAQPDLIAARFLSGEALVGILPPNLAAKVASSGKDLKAAAVIGTGMLSLLTSDPEIRSTENLRGKTVEVAGQGATPDYVFRRILSLHSIAPDRDIRLGYSLGYPEIAQSLIAGRVSTALLPEPFATMALLGKPDLHLAANIQEKWVRAGGNENYPMTLLVMDGAFVSANAQAADDILGAVRNSIEWVMDNPAAAGELVEKHNFGIRAPVAEASIPRSNYVFIPAAVARTSIEALFALFLEYAPVSIGGVLPGDGFYLK